ncbi:MAG: hypothetical protein EBT38_00175 [Acidimicrobiia bacterium]|nr:hypothetical protein [Acidimicrobiia bacterium]
MLLMCAAGYAVLSVGLVILGSGETRRDPAAMLPEVGPASAGVSGIATATPVMLASVDQPARAS